MPSKQNEVEKTVMINRALIRTKIVQIVYAYCQNENKNLDNGEKELFFSLSKAYDLYNFLLLLMVEVTRYARQRIEAEITTATITQQTGRFNKRFVNNRFISQLEVNEQLNEFVSNKNKSWSGENIFIKKLFGQIEDSDIYKAYMTSNVNSYEDDREVWRRLYKTFIERNDDLDQILEDQSLYWNDDKDVVDTFVIKTIKKFDENNKGAQPLLPEFKDEEDMEFARRLFRRTIMNQDFYRHLISEGTRNWTLDRIALMDVIIMQVALAEILSFPSIPVNVSLNEYVEIAKHYSTPKSGAFINGTLDGIVNQLKKEGKLEKN